MKQTLGSILYTVNSCSANHCSNLFSSNNQYLLCFCLTLSLKNTLDQLLSAALFSGLESDCRYLVPEEEKDAGRKKKNKETCHKQCEAAKCAACTYKQTAESQLCFAICIMTKKGFHVLILLSITVLLISAHNWQELRCQGASEQSMWYNRLLVVL